MWYAPALDSPSLVLTRQPSFTVNIEVVCMYLGQAGYILGMEWLFKHSNRFATRMCGVQNGTPLPCKMGARQVHNCA